MLLCVMVLELLNLPKGICLNAIHGVLVVEFRSLSLACPMVFFFNIISLIHLSDGVLIGRSSKKSSLKIRAVIFVAHGL